MKKEIINKITNKLESNPLVAIDYLIQALSEEEAVPKDPKDQKWILNLLCQAVLKKLKIKEDFWKKDSTKCLFNQNLSHENQRFIAICLLRLLSVDSELFSIDSDFHFEAFRLFDKVIADDIYKHLSIKTSDQTYEKENKLRDVAPTCESRLRGIIKSWNKFESVTMFRQNFMKEIRSNLSRSLLYPFLPLELLDIRLDEIFSIAEEYLNEKGPLKAEVFEKAIELFGKYKTQADLFGTVYSGEFLGQIVGKLLLFIREHFSKSPFSKPATLSVELPKKKYPLYSKDRDFIMNFIIKNDGLGHAFDVHFIIDSDLRLGKSESYLGSLEPGNILIEIPARVDSVQKSVEVIGEINWVNFDKTVDKISFNFELESQRADIYWDRLKGEDPYSLEPVTTEDKLVGRTEYLDRLMALANAQNIGSSYISGQKRVGKTSIVKILQERLTKLNMADYLIIYLEGGDYVHPDPKKTIENLGKRLCEEIMDSDRRFNSLNQPNFDGALSPLSEFLRDVRRIAPNYKVLFILDEFDELPSELYKRGSIGDAFFLTLRSISAKGYAGFVLVGSEKMEFILSCQGEQLNKFSPIKIDYFDKGKHWLDFQNLIKKPVEQWLEISDDALTSLYEQSAGNPYFAKLICKELFKMMVDRKDCYVTNKEINEATLIALQEVEAPSFQHFWEDSIFFESGTRAEEISINRRKLLLIIAETLRRYGTVQKKHILELVGSYNLDKFYIENELRDFERRQILLKDADDRYKCKIRFFEEWLKEKGVREIITTFTDLDKILEHRKIEEASYVRAEEIIELMNCFGEYKGRRITTDQARNWLTQFGNNSSQRLMFRILKHVKFYSADNIRTKMKEAHGIIIRGLVRRVEEAKRKRSDILVSYTDGPGKSGAEYAKLYADENEVYYENVINLEKLELVLKDRTDLQALVFIDDFIGTGNSACEYFEKLNEKYGNILRNSKLQMFFIAISGFQDAQDKIENYMTKLNFNVKIHICDPLSESDKCFSEKSTIFTESDDRLKAEEICHRYGMGLVKNAPLGYGNCQAIIVFTNSCPNNSLPILWEQSKDWVALFRRL